MMPTWLTGYFVIYCAIIINGQTYIENTYIDTVYDVWTMDGPYESNDFAVPGCDNIPANTPFHGPFHDERQRFYQVFRCLHESDVTIYYSEAFGCGTNDVTQDYIELIVNGESKVKSSKDIILNLDNYECDLEYQSKCQDNEFLVYDRVVALGTFTPNDDIRVEFETKTNQPNEELIVALVRVECIRITEAPSNNPSNSPSMNPTIVPTNNPTQTPSALPTDYPSVTPTAYITSTTTGHTTYSPSQNPTLIRNVVIQFWENQWILIGIISMTVTLILCCVVLFCIYMLRNANNKESNINSNSNQSNNNSSISTVIIPNQIINNSNDNKNNIFSTMNTTVEGIPKNPELIISDIITPSHDTPKDGIHLNPHNPIISMDSEQLYEIVYENEATKNSAITATKNIL